MATVNMDLSEVDKMRQDIKDSLEKVKELEKEKTQILSDKRVIKITTKDIVQPNPSSLRKSINSALSRNASSIFEKLKDIQRYGTPRSSMTDEGVQFIDTNMAQEISDMVFYYERKNLGGSNYTEIDNIVASFYIENGKRHAYTSKSSNTSEGEKEYLNFDDVKIELRQEIEKQVQTELSEARRNLGVAEANLTSERRSSRELLNSVKTEHGDTIAKIEIENSKFIDQLKITYKEELDKLQDRIKELTEELEALKAGKKYQSEMQVLKEQVETLTMKLAHEQSRTWWEKMLGLNQFRDEYKH